MARLKSHGTELLRMRREGDVKDALVSWRADEVVAMSDGYTLTRRMVRFIPELVMPTMPTYHDYGWKLGPRWAERGDTTSGIEQRIAGLRDAFEAQGYKEVKKR